MDQSITIKLILEAAEKRGWTTRLITDNPYVYALEAPGKAPYFIRTAMGFRGPGVNTFLTKHKEILYEIAHRAGIAQVPETIKVGDDNVEAEQMLQKYGKVVVKPTDQSHGDGVTVGIDSVEALKRAIDYARTYSDDVIVQQHVEGDDYRLLYIDGAFVAATLRKPAAVIGDGHSTIRELIDEENARDTLSDGSPKPPARKINLEAVARYLGDETQTVPNEGEEVRVVGTANIGNGGSAIDYTDDIPESVIQNGVDLLAYLRLEFGGVDYIIQDGIPYLIEVNVVPSFGLHSYPTSGTPRPVADVYLDWLEKSSR